MQWLRQKTATPFALDNSGEQRGLEFTVATPKSSKDYPANLKNSLSGIPQTGQSPLCGPSLV